MNRHSTTKPPAVAPGTPTSAEQSVPAADQPAGHTGSPAASPHPAETSARPVFPSTDKLAQLWQCLCRFLCRCGIPANAVVDAQDLAQDIFLALLRHLHNGLPIVVTLRALLFGIARHKVCDYHRQRAAGPVVGLAPEVLPNLPDPGFDGYSHEDLADAEEILHAAEARLDPTIWEAFVNVRLRGLTQTATAVASQVSRATIAAHLKRVSAEFDALINPPE